ncbi:uncharacterized protein [Amphiura filiformis]|uniref:uncharacterized protein n=1 Tax=Amphiura filiformis TaxID=82378 RepID=UPI003B21E963
MDRSSPTGTSYTEETQLQAFRNWCNKHLETVDEHIDNLETDLSDGLKLITLVEVLSKKKVPGNRWEPTNAIRKLSMVSKALEFLQETEHVDLIGIGKPGSILDGDQKVILGLVWQLIQHYSKLGGGKGPTASKQPSLKEKLLEWLREKLPSLKISNFKEDWRDGRALGALFDVIVPGAFPDWKVWTQEHAFENINEAMEFADDWLNVYKLVTADNILNPLTDENAMITYIEQFCHCTPDQIFSSPKGIKRSKALLQCMRSDQSKVDFQGGNLSLSVIGAKCEIPEGALRKDIPAVDVSMSIQDNIDDFPTIAPNHLMITPIVSCTAGEIESFDKAVTITLPHSVESFKDLDISKLGDDDIHLWLRSKQGGWQRVPGNLARGTTPGVWLKSITDCKVIFETYHFAQWFFSSFRALKMKLLMFVPQSISIAEKQCVYLTVYSVHKSRTEEIRVKELGNKQVECAKEQTIGVRGTHKGLTITLHEIEPESWKVTQKVQNIPHDQLRAGDSGSACQFRFEKHTDIDLMELRGQYDVQQQNAKCEIKDRYFDSHMFQDVIAKLPVALSKGRKIPLPKIGRDKSKHAPDKGEVLKAMDMVSDKDIIDVAYEADLAYNDLEKLYLVLEIKTADIDNAKRFDNTQDFKLQATRVLQHWRKTNGSKANRKAILDALQTCDLNEAKEILEEKWRLKDDDEPQQATTPIAVVEPNEPESTYDAGPVESEEEPVYEAADDDDEPQQATTPIAVVEPNEPESTYDAGPVESEEEPVYEAADGMTWQFMHTVDPAAGWVYACHMISPNQLAVCLGECVQVYTVSANNSTLAYTVSSEEWKGRYIYGVAVSECMPDSMLVICAGRPYVYQFKCKKSNKEINKYEIQGDNKSPWCISANASVAVIRMYRDKSFIVCGLPQFTHQSRVQIDFPPLHFSMTSEYLLVMDEDVMLVRALSDVRQDVWRVEIPDGCEFRAVSFRNNGREIYAACSQGGLYGEGRVYKYTWDGVGKPEYINSSCIIDGLGVVGGGNLSVTSDGFLAVGQWDDYNVRIYKLQ